MSKNSVRRGRQSQCKSAEGLWWAYRVSYFHQCNLSERGSGSENRAKRLRNIRLDMVRMFGTFSTHSPGLSPRINGLKIFRVGGSIPPGSTISWKAGPRPGLFLWPAVGDGADFPVPGSRSPVGANLFAHSSPDAACRFVFECANKFAPTGPLRFTSNGKNDYSPAT